MPTVRTAGVQEKEDVEEKEKTLNYHRAMQRNTS